MATVKDFYMYTAISSRVGFHEQKERTPEGLVLVRCAWETSLANTFYFHNLQMGTNDEPRNWFEY
jgi:hypothetical protein